MNNTPNEGTKQVWNKPALQRLLNAGESTESHPKTPSVGETGTGHGGTVGPS